MNFGYLNLCAGGIPRYQAEIFAVGMALHIQKLNVEERAAYLRKQGETENMRFHKNIILSVRKKYT
ncbi:hypothetical protein BPLS_P4532 [Bathymodiolus platifrons methanotrophic gill symbiont]|uniref:hypothetical protein n=1 Tax=Bathymodiolus platifrons methanotrophic gill symbiont TaxID=113268 RepID=UPI00132CAA66|nr:hypothetical protein [Bathymodiolus platifrons methanotrophic gill symbiont]TXL02260.1 hypothetical protein BMR07_18160 [Methylococcaceae bacterium CS1]TXL03134.1 hypothetical protein BMR09_15455 [Methylococcaceae bacterium CS3]GFO76628.1 hypothetical protein BPLS_P4532 [Bathymodiolus platifrons methanotrophic gill symbiont]